MLQTIVAAHVPHSEKPPRLATYILSALLLAALNVVTCALVIHAADREFAHPHAPPPGPLARAVRLLARLLDARAAQKSATASCTRFGVGTPASVSAIAGEGMGVTSYGLREAASVCLEQVPVVSRLTRHTRAHAHTKRARQEALSRLVTTSTGPLIGAGTAAGAPSAGSANRDDGGHEHVHVHVDGDGVRAAVGTADSDSDTRSGGTKAQIIKSFSSTSVPAAAAAVSWTAVSDVLNRLFGLVNLALLLLVMAIFLFPVML